MSLIIPYLPDEQPATIEIDGITYSPPLVDANGRLFTSAVAPSASDIKVARLSIASSSTRQNLVIGVAGKRIRVVSVRVNFSTAVANRAEIYFGGGADITTNPTLEVDEIHNGGLAGWASAIVWPDSGGPIGTAGQTLSGRASVSTSGPVLIIASYREE